MLREVANSVIGPQACVLAPLSMVPVLLLTPRRRRTWAGAATAIGLIIQAAAVLLVAAGAGWLGAGAVARSSAAPLWLAGVGATADLRLDGMNLLPALLTPLLALGALVASPREATDDGRARGLALLVTAAAAAAAFCAFDLIVMCFALQVATLGAAFLLGRADDGAGRRAAIRFTIYHLGASAGLLGVVLALQLWLAGPVTASLEGLSRAAPPASVQSILLAGSVLCFAVPLALAPAHGWAARCAGSGSRTGVLLVMGLWPLLGVHGLCRVSLGLFPAAAAHWAGAGATLAALASLYAALIAAAQPDLTRRLAWVVAAAAGPVFLALCAGTAEGIVGALLLACAQAPARLALAALAKDAPAAVRRGASGWWAMAALALVALPGFGSFAGLFLAAPAVARSWPTQGLIVLAAFGLATGALLAPHAALRRRGAVAAGKVAGGVRLVATAALALSLAAGLRPLPLVEVIRPAVNRIPLPGRRPGPPALEPAAFESGVSSPLVSPPGTPSSGNSALGSPAPEAATPRAETPRPVAGEL